jgi:hypothetical protein
MSSTVFFDRLTALLFLFAVAGSTFNKGIALLDYHINGNYIASNLCENKDKPNSCCHGRCFLKKQMQKEDSEKNGSSTVRDNLEITWFFEENPSENIAILSSVAHVDRYLMKSYHTSLSSCFHPPAAPPIV